MKRFFKYAIPVVSNFFVLIMIVGILSNTSGRPEALVYPILLLVYATVQLRILNLEEGLISAVMLLGVRFERTEKLIKHEDLDENEELEFPSNLKDDQRVMLIRKIFFILALVISWIGIIGGVSNLN